MSHKFTEIYLHKKFLHGQPRLLSQTYVPNVSIYAAPWSFIHLLYSGPKGILKILTWIIHTQIFLIA